MVLSQPLILFSLLLTLAILLDFGVIWLVHKYQMRQNPAQGFSRLRNDLVSSPVFWIFLWLLGTGIMLVSFPLALILSQKWISFALLVAGIFIVHACARKTEPIEQRLPSISPISGENSPRLRPWQIVCLALSPLLAALAAHFAGFGYKMTAPWAAIFCWLAGIGLVVAGGLSASPFRGRERRAEWIRWTGLVGAAFLIRAIYVTRLPLIFAGDEASIGLDAVRFIKGSADNIFRGGWFNFPLLYSFIQSISISLLGQNLLALRITSVIIGALTVGGVYWLTRALFGEPAALFAAIFLAAFHLHNHFSRIGLNNIWDGFWYVIVLGCLWVGWRSDRRNAFLMGGIFLGLAQYFYISARLLILLVPAWLLLAGIFDLPRLKRAGPIYS